MDKQGSDNTQNPQSAEVRNKPLATKAGIWLAGIATFSICVLYLLITLANAVDMYMGAKKWVSLAYAAFAFFMLIAVDRRMWAKSYEEIRRALNLLLALCPIGSELIETYIDDFKHWFYHGRLTIDLIFIIVNVLFIGALIIYFTERNEY